MRQAPECSSEEARICARPNQRSKLAWAAGLLIFTAGFIYSNELVESFGAAPAEDIDTQGSQLGADHSPAGHPATAYAAVCLLPLFLLGVVLAHGGPSGLRAALAEPDDGLRAPPVQRWERLLVWAVIAAGAVLRLANAGGLPLNDAEWSNVEHLPFGVLFFHGYEVLTNPPLMLAVQHYVYELTHAAAGIRLPTIVMGTALIWATWRAGRELFGRRAGLLAAALIALHAGAVVWSQTVRYYVPATLLLTLALPHGYRLGRRWCLRDGVGVGLFGLLACWTHYLSVIILVLGSLAALWQRREDRPALLRLGALGAWFGLAFLPLAPFFLGEIGAAKQGWGLEVGYPEGVVTLITGLPWGLGWVALLLGAGFGARRDSVARWLIFLLCGYLATTVATHDLVFWEAPYGVPLIPVYALLLARSVMLGLKPAAPRLRAWLLGVLGVLQLAPTLLVFALPSESLLLSQGLMPIVHRGMSIGSFSGEILRARRDHPKTASCPLLLVTPAFDMDSFLFYLGPLTSAEAGLDPIVDRIGQRAGIDLPLGAGSATLTILGAEPAGSWHEGVVRSLDGALREAPCVWFARSRQSCVTGRGLFYSVEECRWLGANCELVRGYALDELYRCSAP